MTSTRPYLLRALHEWILDNGMTPYILVDAAMDGVVVPEHTVQNGKVVLNLSPTAVKDLDIGNEILSFVARFSGVTSGLLVPVGAVLAIYAHESNQGMLFQQDSTEADPVTTVSADDKSGKKGRSHLKVIK